MISSTHFRRLFVLTVAHQQQLLTCLRLWRARSCSAVFSHKLFMLRPLPLCIRFQATKQTDDLGGNSIDWNYTLLKDLRRFFFSFTALCYEGELGPHTGTMSISAMHSNSPLPEDPTTPPPMTTPPRKASVRLQERLVFITFCHFFWHLNKLFCQ